MLPKTRDEVIADMQVAADRMGLGIADLQEMVVSVLEDCKQKTIELRSATVAGDHLFIKSLSHDIKGSSANYGLNELTESAREIENNDSNLPLKKVETLLELIDHLLNLELDI